MSVFIVSIVKKLDGSRPGVLLFQSVVRIAQGLFTIFLNNHEELPMACTTYCHSFDMAARQLNVASCFNLWFFVCFILDSIKIFFYIAASSPAKELV